MVDQIFVGKKYTKYFTFRFLARDDVVVSGILWFVRQEGPDQCDQKNLPNVYKSCPIMIDFDTFTKIA